jgi:hypothetical protein
MSQVKTYTPRYPAILERSGKSFSGLTDDLQANAAWHKADVSTKARLLPALVQTDAFIAAAIERTTKPPDKIDKVKLMAMKAKALLQKKK